MKPLLNIKLSNGLFIDPIEARVIGDSFKSQYNNNEPFPHIAIDNLFPEEMIEALLQDFPKIPLQSDKNYDRFYERGKRSINPLYCANRAKIIFNFLNSEPFLQFLEGITGIDGLIPDPYFKGGGYHETCRDGRLGIHADFRLQQHMHLERRINLLIYLNKDWQTSYGGDLELWSRNMAKVEKKIAPIFGRSVLFNTDKTSFHGHPDPLTVPEEITRKSVALYYYTASKLIYQEVDQSGTNFQPRNESEKIASTSRYKRSFSTNLRRIKNKLFSRKTDF